MTRTVSISFFAAITTATTMMASIPFAMVSALSPNSQNRLLVSNRPEVLNLLNHPLQLQLATGDLQLECFRRLIEDRRAIVEGIETAVGNRDIMEGALESHDQISRRWLGQAEERAETSLEDSVESPTKIELECADDFGVSQSAQALASVVRANGIVGAASVLRCYSFACERLLCACASASTSTDAQDNCNGNGNGNVITKEIYHEWLRVHAEGWSELADRCEEAMEDSKTATTISSSSSLCISMLYNWIDNEAATTGIRADLNDPKLSFLTSKLEELEPGYAKTRDKHASFVADITGKATSQIQNIKAEAKVNAAAAYLAAKKQQKKNPAAKKSDLASKRQPKKTSSTAANKAEAYLRRKQRANTINAEYRRQTKAFHLRSMARTMVWRKIPMRRRRTTTRTMTRNTTTMTRKKRRRTGSSI